MEFTESSTIAELIKHNKDSIQAIASLAKPLEKLKNPLLRKLMASRVTVSEAAKMGGCTVEDFASVLTPLGFVFKTQSVAQYDSDEEVLPQWLTDLESTDIENFDVRQMLAAGTDPLKAIMDKFKKLSPGRALCIINTFIPVPLIRLLEKDGVFTFSKTLKSDEHHTYFFKQPLVKPTADEFNKEETETENVRSLRETDFLLACKKFPASKVRQVDVRALAMPAPMQTILAELSSMEQDEALYVNHKRVPLYLLEEIADEDYIVNILSLSETDVRLFIHKRIDFEVNTNHMDDRPFHPGI